MADGQSTELVEEWLPVTGWPYEVSNLGKVRRCVRASGTRVGTVLQTKINKGYPIVTLADARPKRRRSAPVHLLVCEAFHGLRPAGMWARHRNGDSTDASAANVIWDYPALNIRDKYRHGTMPLGEKSANAKITDEQFIHIMRIYRMWPRRRGAIRIFIDAVCEHYGLRANYVHEIIYPQRGRSARRWRLYPVAFPKMESAHAR